MFSPIPATFRILSSTEDCPEAVAVAATPFSSAAILFSNISVVVFVMRV